MTRTEGQTEELEYRGHGLRISRTDTEWLVLMTPPGAKPTLIAASDREAAVQLAHKQIDELLGEKAGSGEMR